MEFNKKNIKIILGIISFTIIFAAICIRFSSFISFLSEFISIFMPFIVGGAIAFVLNVFMKIFEEKLFGKIKLKKIKRIISLLLTIILVILIILLLIRIVVPELVLSIKSITRQIPQKTALLNEWLNVKFNFNKVDQIFDLIAAKLQAITADDLQNAAGILSPIVKLLSSTLGIVSGTISSITNFFIAFVFSIYILLNKEKLARQAKQILYAFIPEIKADKISKICSMSNRVFQKFITGQCTEAVILGTMFFVSMLVLRIPYALMVSMIIAFSSLVPIVGAFVGCFVGTFLIFIESPAKAIIFIIMFFVLQQIEGNLIYPHVVGNSVGLPSMWVLFAVTIGGSIMGVWGMLIFIPLSSVMYELFREYIIQKIQTKNISSEKFEPVIISETNSEKISMFQGIKNLFSKRRASNQSVEENETDN